MFQSLGSFSKKKWQIDIGGDPDFEDLVADIYYEHTSIARLSQEEGFDNLLITIYPPDVQEWCMDLNDFESAIQHAKKRLWDLRRIEEPS